MKQKICLLFLLIGVICSNAYSNIYAKDSLIFKEFTFDFGEILQGTKVCHKFNFENTSDSLVTIKDVITQCGCTVGNYQKEPIPAGDTSEIEICFDSDGKYGRQRKTIRVVTSSGQEVKLIILANIYD